CCGPWWTTRARTKRAWPKRTNGQRTSRRGGKGVYTAPYRLLPPLVFRRQRLVPLQQLRLPAPQPNVFAPYEYVLDPRREIEGITAPDDDVRDLPGVQGSVPIRHAKHLGGRQRHRPPRLLPPPPGRNG